jgi:hypothetical protein
MKIRLLACCITAVFLYGCANQKTAEIQNWATTTKLEAKAGNLKWSEYYKGLYERLTTTSFEDTPFLMEVTSTLIDASLAFESGKMDREQFESLQRQAEIAHQKNNSQMTQQSRAAWTAAMQRLANSQQQSQQFYREQLRRQTNCETKWTGYAWKTVCQ